MYKNYKKIAQSVRVFVLIGTFFSPVNLTALTETLNKLNGKMKGLASSLTTLKDNLLDLKDVFEGKTKKTEKALKEQIEAAKASTENFTNLGFTVVETSNILGSPFTENFDDDVKALVEMTINKLSLKPDKKFVPGGLDEIAKPASVLPKGQGLGYKTGNLQILERLEPVFMALKDFIQMKQNGRNVYRVKVPNFIGISSDNIKTFLANKGVDVQARWDGIKAKYSAKAGDFFNNGKTFSKEFLDDLGDLETAVQAVFEHEALTALDNYDFNTVFNTPEVENKTPGIKKTIEAIQKARRSMMVRSTGMEDTDELANAGGNESVANVSPNPSDILKAMGIVAASYFSAKSYGQRLSGTTTLAQAQALIDENPFTPVLLQRMIGERIQGIRHENIIKYLSSVEINGQKISFDEVVHPNGKDKLRVVELTPVNNVRVNTVFNKLSEECDKNADAFSFNRTFSTEESEIDELIEHCQQADIGIVIESAAIDDATKEPIYKETFDALKLNIISGMTEAISRLLAKHNNYFALKIYPKDSMMSDSRISIKDFLPPIDDSVKDEEREENIRLRKARETRLRSDIRSITSCGVMFTEEAEGGIARLDEKRLEKVKTATEKVNMSGITKIEASYGHNEGVVNSLVGVDAYYMAGLESVYEVIRPKRFRKFPSLTQWKKLEDMNNPRILDNRPALTKDELLTLKLIANVLEEYYKKPMDVEFVIDHKERTVYLVQARPITNKADQASPSYLTDKAADQLGQQFAGVVIGAAGGALRPIVAKNQVIIESSINVALDTYEKSTNKNEIQCILIGKDAPGTSHEATQFRIYGKPVIWVKNDLNKVTGLVEQGIPLIVDVQQELIVEWKGPQTTVQELVVAGYAVDGAWATYPLPLALSVMQNTADLSENEFKAILERLGILKESGFNTAAQKAKDLGLLELKGGDNFYKNVKKCLKEALDTSKTKENLAALFVVIDAYIRNYQKMTTATPEHRKILTLLHNAFLKSLNLVLNTLPEGGKEDKELERRYALRFIEALVFQESSNVVNASSFMSTIFKSVHKEQTVIKELKIGAAAGVLKTGTISEIIKAVLGKAVIKDKAIPKDIIDNAVSAFEAKAGKDVITAIIEVADSLRAAGMSEPRILKIVDEIISNAGIDAIVYYLAYIKPLGFTTQVQNDWEAFVKSLSIAQEADKEKFNKFAAMIADFARLNVLPAWLHTSFVEQYQSPDTALDDLIKEYDGIKGFIKALSVQQEKMGLIDVAHFAEESKFQKAFAELKSILKFLTTDEVANNETFKVWYAKNAVGPLVKPLCVGFMEEFVDKFDLCIKSLKGRPYKVKAGDKEVLDPIKLKSLLDDWHTMLENYLAMLSVCIGIHPIQAEMDAYGVGGYCYTKPREKRDAFSTRLNNIKNIYDENQFNNSDGFDVNEMVIGSTTQCVTLDKESREDLFTLIHQSLLNVLAFLLSKTKVSEINNPQFLINVQTEINKLGNYNQLFGGGGVLPYQNYGGSVQASNFKLDYSGKAVPAGIEVLPHILRYHYNHPLRSHSASIDVAYSNKGAKETCSITTTISGHNEYGRWDKIADFGAFLCTAKNLEYEVELRSKSVKFTFIIKQGDDKTLIPHIIVALLQLSYAVNNLSDANYGESDCYSKTAGINKFSIDNNSFATTVYDLCLKEGRVCAGIMLAVDKMDKSNQSQQEKLLKVLAKLARSFSSYGLNSDLLWFKKHTSTNVGDPNLGSNYYLLDSALFGPHKKIKDYKGAIVKPAAYGTKTLDQMQVLIDEYKQKLFKELVTEISKPAFLNELSDDNLKLFLEVLQSNCNLVLSFEPGNYKAFENIIFAVLYEALANAACKSSALDCIKTLIAYAELHGNHPISTNGTKLKNTYKAYFGGTITAQNINEWKESFAISFPDQFILLVNASTNFETLFINASTHKDALLEAAQKMVTYAKGIYKEFVESKEHKALNVILKANSKGMVGAPGAVIGGNDYKALINEALADKGKTLNLSPGNDGKGGFVNDMEDIYNQDTSPGKADSIDCISQLITMAMSSMNTDWLIKALEISHKNMPGITKISMDTVTDKLKDENESDFLGETDTAIIEGFLNRLTAVDSGATKAFKQDLIDNMSQLEWDNNNLWNAIQVSP